jgi:hypothetical protein
MALSFVSVALTLLSLWIIHKSYCFYKNYVAAVRTGYPVYTSPVSFLTRCTPANRTSASRKALAG